MAKNNGKTAVVEPQKMWTLEENVHEVDQLLLDFMFEMYESQQQTWAIIDQKMALFSQWMERLTDLIHDRARLGETR